MAEFEFGGMTFKGGKMFAILTALSTLGVLPGEDSNSTKTIWI